MKALLATAVLIGFFFFANAKPSQAAEAPLSVEQLRAKATHIVSGKVLEVTSKTQKSAVEKAAGVHRDKIFTLTVEVDKPQKGSGFKRGDKITVIAWQPSLRIPPLPGLQGHETIPEKGGSATFYLKEAGDGTYEPVHANAIQEDEG